MTSGISSQHIRAIALVLQYFFARRYGLGSDVSDPMGYSTVRLAGKIKTVDWIVALNADLVRAAGGPASWKLPPDWFVNR